MNKTESSAVRRDRELAIEQAHIDKVYVQLKKAEQGAKNVAAESHNRFHSDRHDWLREEANTALFERDAFAYQAAKRLATLDAQHEGLVFGRLDFSNDPEIRYIGRLGVRDDDYEPLVIDWRAPAAEAFYRATAVNPMGVSRRRVLRCRDDVVIGIEDDLLDAESTDLVVVGEGALMAALKRARGHQMRDIVATIQAEQDEAIRAPYPGVTVISGGPGTGKTVVALHRAAFLLYTHRKRLQQGGLLVVGPTDIFMNYIERVLPGLGEDSVTLKSVGKLASDVLKLSSQRPDDPDAWLIKGSTAMIPVLKRAVLEPLSPSNQHLRVSFKGEILTMTPSQLAAIRKQVLGNHRYNDARHAAETAVLKSLWNKLPREIISIYDATPEAFNDMVCSQASWQMFWHGWWPSLTPEMVLARLAEPEFLRKVAGRHLDDDQQEIFLDSLEIARGYVPDAGFEHPDWSISDIALLDELYALLGPAPRSDDDDEPEIFLEGLSEVEELVTIADKLTFHRQIDEDSPVTYSHVLVDEAQDITPMQWRMLRRRGPQSSWTLVGDPAQSSYPDPTQTQQMIDELVGTGPYRTFTLSKNYRSPKEVMDLAAQVITAVDPDAQIPDAVRSTGIDPVLKSSKNRQLTGILSTSIMDLAGHVEGTIAVIAPPGRFASLRDTLKTMGTPPEVSARLTLITALQSKGLEYDAAIVVAPDEIVAQTPGGIRVLYVALTRPTQRLITIDINLDGVHWRWRESLESPKSDSE